jgi:hypothetical protein
MVDHEPWRGPYCESGIEGQRIAIVGYSHHRNANDVDNNQFTINVVRNVLIGKQKGDSLFATVPGYFGYANRVEFWNRVWFFNFIPECIGTSDEKYAVGTDGQIQRARARFMRILRVERPNKVFVFTKKGWPKCPFTAQEERGEDCTPLGDGFDDFSWGRYVFSDHTVAAFGLRHPQCACKAQMMAAVKKALTIN